jgi:hypothetical protein
MITYRAPPMSDNPVGPARILRNPYIEGMEPGDHNGNNQDEDKDPHQGSHFIYGVSHTALTSILILEMDTWIFDLQRGHSISPSLSRARNES